VKLTRKWEFVAQEAARLAGLGLSPREIGKRIGVNRSSVTRWIQKGKLEKPNVAPKPKPEQRAALIVSQNPDAAKWATTVRKDFGLSATDERLVMLGVLALETAHDVNLKANVRMTAAGRFQAIVKQLALTSRGAEAAPVEPEKPEPQRYEPVQRTGTDPRKLLMAVK
jgi:hypothetical protein